MAAYGQASRPGERPGAIRYLELEDPFAKTPGSLEVAKLDLAPADNPATEAT
jgi:hypothetical protein